MTEMGRDLLTQDYMLKQLTASLIYPEEDVGRTFWEEVYRLAFVKFKTTEVPINTFNKVWILPDRAVIYENEGTAFIGESRLKVMLEADYLALDQNLGKEKFGTDQVDDPMAKVLNDLTSGVIRRLVLPHIRKEVNEGKYDQKIKEEKTELSAEELKKLEEEKKKLAEEMEKSKEESEGEREEGEIEGKEVQVDRVE